MTGAQLRTCVVIAYWTGEPQTQLHRLLREISTVSAGAPFNVRIICNGGDRHPLVLPHTFGDKGFEVWNRENTGYNIAAWDYGWRVGAPHEFYLFLQTECFVKQSGWLEAFEFRMDNDPGVGLLGEWIQWDHVSWPFIRKATDRDLGMSAWPAEEVLHPIDTYKALLATHGIPLGDVGTHVPTIMHFTSRRILEDVGGYPYFGASYLEAVAVEIGMSRLIESHGYRVCQLKGRAFTYIGHRQWTPLNWHQRFRTQGKKIVKRIWQRFSQQPKMGW